MSEHPDPSLEKTGSSQPELQEVLSEIEKILETLITNDTEILEALAQIVLVVPQMHARNEQNQAKLVEEIGKQVRALTLEFVEKNSSSGEDADFRKLFVGTKLLQKRSTDPFDLSPPSESLHRSQIPARIATRAGLRICQRCGWASRVKEVVGSNPFEAQQRRNRGRADVRAAEVAVAPERRLYRRDSDAALLINSLSLSDRENQSRVMRIPLIAEPEC